MKRFFAILLTLALAIGGTAAALAEEYGEHMDFVANYIDYGVPAAEDEMYHWILDRFNMDIEMIGLSQADYSQQNTLAISGGNLNDWTQWAFKYGQYVNYVSQGMLRALPEGWETRWPNIYNMVDKSGILDALYIDGRVYCIPHGINVNLVEGRTMSHTTLYYRADWAEQVGIEIGETITLDGLKEYLKAVTDAGLTKIGLNGETGNILSIFMNMYSEHFSDFRRVDGAYIWGPCGEGVLEGIKAVKEFYNAGLINADFYSKSNIECRDLFTSGLAATYFGDGTISNYELLNQNAAAAGIDNYIDAIKCTVIVNDAGNYNSTERTNFWTGVVFNPTISDERLERALDMIDFCCTKECELAINMGLPEVDWTTAEDGSYVILREAEEDGTYTEIKNVYNSLYFFWFMGVLPDEFTFVNPGLDATVKERISRCYAIRGSSPDYIPLDNFYNFFSGEAKSQYTVDVTGEVARIVADPSITADAIEGEWNAFIENYRGIWEPVVEELNAALAAK